MRASTTTTRVHVKIQWIMLAQRAARGLGSLYAQATNTR